MRNNFYGLLLLLPGIFICNIASAQDNIVVESGMRSNGKIYVVLAICITILAGLFLYLLSIDRKIAKIEDRE